MLAGPEDIGLDESIILKLSHNRPCRPRGF